MERIIAFIPARGGSKGLPGKNLRRLGDAPLIAHTIQPALRSGCFDRVIVSTDDADIAEVARRHGAEVPWLRPPELATDDAPVVDAVLHGLDRVAQDEGYRPDAVALLQPTAPFRTTTTLRRGVELFQGSGGDSVVSVTLAAVHPYWCQRIDADGCLHPFLEGVEVPASRQQLPPAYQLNGLLYLARTETIREHRSFYGARTRALVVDETESLDIDTAEDWDLALYLWRLRGERRGE